jgi:hypothetical protein
MISDIYLSIQYLGGEIPCLGPSQLVLIHEKPHELCHSNGWVSVIQLESHLFCKDVPVARVGCSEAAQHILGAQEQKLKATGKILYTFSKLMARKM